MMLFQKILPNTVVNSFARLSPPGIACQHTFKSGPTLCSLPGWGNQRRDESRQEVTTVDNVMYRRPSALPAACAQVSGVPVVPAAASAHVAFVGVPAVRVELITGASQIQAQWVQSQEINV